MRITFLGTGTSCGVPVIGCTCPVCLSSDAKDRRLRTSAMFETPTTRILIDCTPDFRMQMMSQEFRRIDALFITHEHYDHVGGVDDVRPFCKLSPVSIYAEHNVNDSFRQRMPYCFREHLYPGVPKIILNDIVPGQRIVVGDITVIPFRVMHGKLPILGFKVNDVVYITDMTSLGDGAEEIFKELKVLIENALRIQPHPSHQSLDEALAMRERIGNVPTYLIHMCHDIGLHSEVEASLPSDVHLAYDGMVLDV